MSYLIKLLPPSIKSEFVKFMYKETIAIFPFFQNRIPEFYNYLELLKTDKFFKGSFLAKQGKIP